MLDHFGFAVQPSQFEEIVNWYLAALAPLGITKQLEFHGTVIGLGTSKDNAKFWIWTKENAKSGEFHLALSASDHETVDKFHEAALKAGGKDNGEPGVRTMYHPNYYGAFILDPLGNNIEVVDHMPH